MIDLKGDAGPRRSWLCGASWCLSAQLEEKVLCPAAGLEQPLTLASSHSIVPPDLERWRKSTEPSLAAEVAGERMVSHWQG